MVYCKLFSWLFLSVGCYVASCKGVSYCFMLGGGVTSHHIHHHIASCWGKGDRLGALSLTTGADAGCNRCGLPLCACQAAVRPAHRDFPGEVDCVCTYVCRCTYSMLAYMSSSMRVYLDLYKMTNSWCTSHLYVRVRTCVHAIL